MNKKGFSLIELLIVIAIISILVGVAVPYYNDYIYDARVSVLQQNLKTLRDAINQFRGDQGRGPFVVQVNEGGTAIHTDHMSPADSELIAGPIQIIDGNAVRRSEIQYLSRWPAIINPRTGEQIPPSAWVFHKAGDPSDPTAARYYDDTLANGAFDIDAEFAFVDANKNGEFNTLYDTPLFGDSSAYVDVGGAIALDYVNITVTIDGVDY